MKKLFVCIAVITCMVFIPLAGTGFKWEAAKAEAAEKTAKAQEKVVIGFLSMMMAIVWEQDMEAELKALAGGSNASILTMDSHADPALQLQQLDIMIGQGVDGIVVFIADEKMSKAVANKCNKAKIPVMAESIRMIDENGDLVVPVVELDGYGMGVICSEWLVQYLKDNKLTGNYEKMALIDLDMPNSWNIHQRADGVYDKFTELLPDFPKKNIIRANMKIEEGSNAAQQGYNSTSTTITAHPEIDTWLVIAPNDDQGGGASRALEQLGLNKNACVVSMGAESARSEWRKKEDTCWKAASFFSAYDCASLVWEGMMKMVREGVQPDKLWPEYIQKGQKFPLRKFTGTMVTKANFREIMGKYADR